MNVKSNIEKLSKQKLFSELQDLDIEYISQFCKEKKFTTGDILIECENEADLIYFITKGIVFVYNVDDNGHVIPIALICAGDTCGEMGVVTSSLRCAYVEALCDVDTLCISRDNFKKIEDKFPQVDMQMIEVLSSRLRDENIIFEKILAKKAYERVFDLLLLLKDRFPGGIITLTHEKLANIAGITRPRLSEILMDLQRKKIIENKYRQIKLLKSASIQ